MKKTGVLMMSMGILSSCNNTATLENKADSLANKADSFSEKVWDSGKKDVKELKDKIEDKFKKKDSVHK